MKKFIETVPAGGPPILAQELVADVLTKEVWDSIEGLFNYLDGARYYDGSLSGSRNGIILTGFDVTPQGSNLYDISSGIVFFPNIGLARYAGTTGFLATSSIYINPGTPTTEQKTYFDTNLKDYTTTLLAEISSTAGLTGNARIVVSSNEVVWFPSLENILSSLTGGTLSRRHTITDWNMDTTAVYTITVPFIGDVENKLRITKVTCWIRQDGTTAQEYTNLERPPLGGVDYGFIEVVANDGVDNGFTINLNRVSGGAFDKPSYSANGTRGYVIVEYAVF